VPPRTSIERSALRCFRDVALHLISVTEILVENSSNQALRPGSLCKPTLID